MNRTQKMLCKSALLFFCITAVITSTHAQNFNKTYPQGLGTPGNPPSYGDVTSIFPLDIINDGNGNTITLCKETDQRFALIKKDFNGNVIWNEGVQMPDDEEMVEVFPSHLIQTVNNDIIVTGMVVYGTHVNPTAINPFAARFNSSGIYQNAMVYNSNTTLQMTFQYPYTWEVNIVQVKSNPNEFIIVAPGSQDNNPLVWVDPIFGMPYDNDNLVNAIRIEDVSLASVWNRKYYPGSLTNRQNMTSQNPNHLSSTVILQRCNPEALTWVPDPNAENGNKYVIAGLAEELLYNGSFFSYFDFYTFIMSIDDNGNIVDEIRGNYTLPWNLNHHLYWDANDTKLVLVYNSNHNNIAADQNNYNPSSTPINVVVKELLQYDLTPSVIQYYYQTDAHLHDAVGVFENEANDGYVIPVTMTYPSTSNFMNNISLLEIDKSVIVGNNINYFNRYNEQRETRAAAGTKIFSGSVTNYAIAGQTVDPTLGSGDLRVVSTDIAGSTCGVVTPTSGKGFIDFTIYGQPYDYVEWAARFEYTSNFDPISVVYDMNDCNNADNPATWKPAGISPVSAASKAEIFPTVLQGTEHIINIRLNAAQASKVVVNMYSIDGRLLATKELDIVKGEKIYTLQPELSAPGNYIVKITSADRALNMNVKITKL